MELRYGDESDSETGSVRSLGRWPSSVCRKRIGSNSPSVFSMNIWCSDMKSTLRSVVDEGLPAESVVGNN